MTRFLPLARPYIGDEELSSVAEVLRSGYLTTGPKVHEFESRLARYLNQDGQLYSACLNSCTAALFLSLKVLGIKEGDQVIVPTWTFAATAQVVEWLGAELVLCDVLESCLTIDPEKAETLITPKTKAIVPVHIAGFPYEINQIRTLADTYGLKIVEDAAHAIGTQYHGKKIGNFADITCFSFYATKNLAMGEGGAAVSSDSDLIEKISKLAYFGINKHVFKRYEKTGSWAYDIEELGYKFNMDSIHAAIGLAQLKRLDEMNAKRRSIASRYKKELDTSLSYTKDTDDHYHTYHLFPIVLPKQIDRDRFIERLKDRHIGCSVHFIPLHIHAYYRNRFDEGHFETANAVYPRIVSIPMFPSMTPEETDYVIEQVNQTIKELS